MQTNRILYMITQALSMSHEDIIRAYELEGYTMTEEHIANILAKENAEGFEQCSFEELGVFLDGLITLKRGPNPQKNENEEAVELTNNLILKKLRAALNLKEMEVSIVFALVDVELSKQELASLFRKPDHKNYRACSDKLLYSFIRGLDEFYYVGEE